MAAWLTVGSGLRRPHLGPARLGRIGIQLYTVRDELRRDVEGTLARLAEIGFKEVEFAGYPEHSAKSLRRVLDRLKLSAPSSHVDFRVIKTDWDRTLDEARTLGQKYIVVPSVDAEERNSRDDWKRVGALFNRAGEMAAERGLQFAYHNHDSDFQPIDGELPYDVLLRESDPGLVKLEMDLYWITKAGQDPLTYFERWPGRFPMVHIKDMDSTPRRSFADVGSGTIDFPRIFRQASAAGVHHYFYEQDETPGSPFDSAKASFGYLRALRY